MPQDKSVQILSDITTFMKYAKYRDDLKRRETWEEIVTRNMNMHIAKFPELESEIRSMYQFVQDKKVLPSMRSMQFAGRPIEMNNIRGYNCSYLPVDHPDSFSETMWLLLSGTGVGYSVQRHHVDKLPPIHKPFRRRGRKKRYLIGDSIEGWADAVKVLVESYFYGKQEVDFDFRDIRQKGEKLITSGGKAPGPEPLRIALVKIQSVLENAISERGEGTKLKTIEAHDIQCHSADAVLAGGIRRAALISIFSPDDYEMAECKYGKWYETHPERGRANNSAIFYRPETTEEDFFKFWDKVVASQSGEPGVYWTNDPEKNSATNPCLPSWTKMLTPDGLREFGELGVGDTIWSKEGWTKIVDKWSTGVKKVYEYETTAGKFYSTENHEVVSGGQKVQIKDADSIETLVGPNANNTPLNPQDIMDGLVLGDGSVHRASGNLVYLLIGSNDQGYFDSEISHLITKKRPGLKDTACEIETTITAKELPYTYLRRIPERFMRSPLRARGLLRGMFTANGSVADNRITLKTSSRGLAEDTQVLLSSLGIRNYLTTSKPTKIQHHNGEYVSRETYAVNITTGREAFVNQIGFIQGYKNAKIEVIPVKQEKIDYDVRAVTEVSEEEVFDLTVDNESHTFWNMGFNVSNCGEIGLLPYQLCNLTEVNVSDVVDQEDLNSRVRAASFIGTLQATYTDFHYLRDIWRETTEKEALIGVSMTGIASGATYDLDLTQAAEIVKEENERMARILGINPAARTTTVKPSGTASIVLGTSSGIHSWHNDYYIRRVRVGKNEAIYNFLSMVHPEIVEEDLEKPELQAIVSVPQKAPAGASTRDESVFDLLERVKKWNLEWVRAGHRDGVNTHNVSTTISVKEDEWDKVGRWMWDNRDVYNGIAVLPYYGGTHRQAPFEDISEEEFNRLYKGMSEVDLSAVFEDEDNTNLQGEVACAGGECTVVNF